MRKIKKIKTIPIKQEEKTDCVAAVAAMLTRTSLKEFKDIYGAPPELGYWNTNLFDYAEKYNIFIKNFYEKKYFKGRLRKKRKAYIAVISERDATQKHAIYWDGEQVYDPYPLVKNGRDIRTYDVCSVVYFTTKGVPRKERRKNDNK